MMVWISRNTDGNINGVYANRQEGYAEEELPSGDSAVISFLNPPSVITKVTAVQGRLALLNSGLLDQVKAAVTAQGSATEIWWEYSTTWYRDNPLLNALGQGLGLTSEQIDQLFLAASEIE